jgi:phosphoribosylformimino-5-aminoimidazole carboxamide ribotide isomerase
MLVIPAIDLKEGKCVRLREGKMDEETIFSDDPLSTAASWFSQGAELLHIVDLDGAVSGKPMNQEIIFDIASHFPEKRIQIGGGIRNFQSAIQYLQQGIERVIMGTAAVEDPEMLREFCNSYPNRLILGIDALHGQVKTQGWLKGSSITPLELVKDFDGEPIAAVIFTDISKDGMMSGPNVNATLELAKQTDIPVIASGGVSSLEHLKQLSNENILFGAICGRALYESAFTYSEALEVVGR